MTETKKKVKTYQWIKGENFGKISIAAEVQKDKQWLWFEDGSRINPKLIKEYLMEVSDETQILQVPQSIEPASQSQQNEVVTPTPVKTEPTIHTASVMGKMIEKMSKKNVVQIPIEININIPTPSIYSMLAEGMEEEDLNEEIMQVALSQLEIDKLQDYIKEHISNFLNTYYGK